MRFNTALMSKAGGRKYNEDYCAYYETAGHGCYLLADGLGGHRGGAIASKTTGEGIIAAFSAAPGFSREHLEKYLRHALQELEKKEALQPGTAGLKTTLVVMLSDMNQAIWAHVGDSRLYYFQSGMIALQTRDHSLPQVLVDSGEISADQIRFHEDRNRLTAAFESGMKDKIKYSSGPRPLGREDAFLLCSDGFWEYVLEEEMERELDHASGPDQWLAAMEKHLLGRAKSDHDNYSAVAIRVEE